MTPDIHAVTTAHSFARRAAFAVALLFAVAAALHAFWFAEGFPDEGQYWILAQNLAHKGSLTLDGVTPSAMWPPFVPLMLTPLAAAGASFDAARIYFVLFYFASGLLAGALARRILQDRPWVALVATAAVLVNPLYFFAAGNIYPQLVLTPLFLGALWVICRRSTSPAQESRRALALGCLLGVSFLTAASSLFAFLPLLARLLYEDLKSLRSVTRLQAHRGVLAAMAAAVVIIPYMVRNHAHVHPGAYVSLNAGLNLILGNSPATRSDSGVDIAVPDPFAAGIEDSEFARNRFYRETAWRNISANPTHYFVLYGRKFLNGFNNNVATASHGGSGAQSVVLWVYMLAVWIGVFFAITQLRRLDSTSLNLQGQAMRAAVLLTALVLLCYFVNIAGYAVYFTRLRFRLPLDVALSVVSAIGWYLRLERQRTGDSGA